MPQSTLFVSLARSPGVRDPSDLRAGEGHYRGAIGLAHKLGMRPREHASEHVASAITMYREMDMRFWLEQAEAEIRTLDIS